jgi:N-acylneuraminate cytidylyltransferase
MPRQGLPDTYWQTGHIDAIRTDVILGGSMSGDVIFPLLIDPLFSVDLDNPKDWERAEHQLTALGGRIVYPGFEAENSLKELTLLVLDFDGVLTDDKVYVNQLGEETVAAHRGDGMGIALAKKAGIEVIILSTEKNPVVQARAKKLAVPVYQGVDRKDLKLRQIMDEKGIKPEGVAYIGNDINDLPCFPLVGLSACVADSHLEVLQSADLVLKKNGGQGAVREFIDLVLRQMDTIR